MKSEIDLIIKEVERTTKAPLLINIISKRVRQILRGDRPLVETRNLKDPVKIAFKEYYLGKLKIEPADDLTLEEAETPSETGETEGITE